MLLMKWLTLSWENYVSLNWTDVFKPNAFYCYLWCIELFNYCVHFHTHTRTHLHFKASSPWTINDADSIFTSTIMIILILYEFCALVLCSIVCGTSAVIVKLGLFRWLWMCCSRMYVWMYSDVSEMLSALFYLINLLCRL